MKVEYTIKYPDIENRTCWVEQDGKVRIFNTYEEVRDYISTGWLYPCSIIRIVKYLNKNGIEQVIKSQLHYSFDKKYLLIQKLVDIQKPEDRNALLNKALIGDVISIREYEELFNQIESIIPEL